MSSKPERNKIETPVIIAIITLCGTLTAAILGSPLLVKVIEDRSNTQIAAYTATLNVTQEVTQTGTEISQTTDTPMVTSSPEITNTPSITETPVVPTIAPPANAALIFNQDFESGNTSGFGFQSGDWNLARDKGNQVLEAVATSSSANEAAFGPTDFGNGIIETKIQYKKVGEFYIVFRATETREYAFLLNGQEAAFGFKSQDRDWKFSPLTDAAVRPFSTQADIWYTIHLEMIGNQFTAYLDGNKLFTVSDTRLQSGSLEFNLESGTRVLLDDVKVWSYGQ